jgi:hypothetical protein
MGDLTIYIVCGFNCTARCYSPHPSSLLSFISYGVVGLYGRLEVYTVNIAVALIVLLLLSAFSLPLLLCAIHSTKILYMLYFSWNSEVCFYVGFSYSGDKLLPVISAVLYI